MRGEGVLRVEESSKYVWFQVCVVWEMAAYIFSQMQSSISSASPAMY